MAGPLPPMLGTPPQNSSRSSSSPYRPPALPCPRPGSFSWLKLHLRTTANTLSMGANSLYAESLLPPLADALHSAPLRSVNSHGVQIPCAQLFSP